VCGVIIRWSQAKFEFTSWKSRDIPILRAFGFVIEQLDESQLALQTLLSMRHVTPFKDKVRASPLNVITGVIIITVIILLMLLILW
jgi:hypothetical protein